MNEVIIKEKTEVLLDYIMKKCLWQFHSRAWDRERQNANIIEKTMQLLCNEPVEKDTPEERCYYVDAVYLADSYRRLYPWVSEMDKADLKTVMVNLKERLDFLLISGSLNKELTDPRY
ncbi:MAG: Fe-only nitrogenase FeFe protein subunit AnfG [Anaerocolumna sp.]|jgi:nitrogenase delta subunit|nr:Fe-only nitrogenase FeFe protein subunit AnfG [Anaerocolumna sp.]